ncbi:hypothetical protein DFH06DRAFT_1308621 [Mycena polygramma]|nr:hypothetical protein DFH06DRAFT_1308621 [Mycena polygramma]
MKYLCSSSLGPFEIFRSSHDVGRLRNGAPDVRSWHAVTSKAVQTQAVFEIQMFIPLFASFLHRSLTFPTMGQHAGILDLPTELILDILTRAILPTETLLGLARLCQRLYLIALPLYFERHGVDPNAKSVVINMRQDCRDTLQVLQAALFTPQTENITCIFPHPDCKSILPLLRHLGRLERYISRLPVVKRVTLQLDNRGSGCLSVGGDRQLRAWASRLESLLNCIVGKGCTTLTVMYGGQFTRAYELAPPATDHGVISRFLSNRRLRNETHAFHRIPSQGRTRIEMALPRPSYRSSQLTYLEIHSAILLLPPGLSWMLSALRNCPITSLTLTRPAEAAIPWNTVLPLLASAGSGLTSVVLQQGDDGSFFSQADVFDNFISRLPLLRHITLSPRTPLLLSAVDSPRTGLVLHHLETLRAPPAFIQLLVPHADSLPKIQSIAVLWPEMHTMDSASIARLSTALSLALHRPIRPQIRVVLAVSAAPHPVLLHPAEADIRVSLAGVLELEITTVALPYTDIGATAAWIHVFPRVQRVEIVFRATRSTDERRSRNVGANLTTLVKAVKQTIFLAEIKRQFVCGEHDWIGIEKNQQKGSLRDSGEDPGYVSRLSQLLSKSSDLVAVWVKAFGLPELSSGVVVVFMPESRGREEMERQSRKADRVAFVWCHSGMAKGIQRPTELVCFREIEANAEIFLPDGDGTKEENWVLGMRLDRHYAFQHVNHSCNNYIGEGMRFIMVSSSHLIDDEHNIRSSAVISRALNDPGGMMNLQMLSRVTTENNHRSALLPIQIIAVAWTYIFVFELPFLRFERQRLWDVSHRKEALAVLATMRHDRTEKQL